MRERRSTYIIESTVMLGLAILAKDAIHSQPSHLPDHNKLFITQDAVIPPQESINRQSNPIRGKIKEKQS